METCFNFKKGVYGHVQKCLNSVTGPSTGDILTASSQVEEVTLSAVVLIAIY